MSAPRIFVISIMFVVVALASVFSTSARPASADNLSVWTDKTFYYDGEQITICFTVPAPGRVVFTDLTPDGRSREILSGYDDGRGDCISGRVTPPFGGECIRLDYYGFFTPMSATTCFEVVDPFAGYSVDVLSAVNALSSLLSSEDLYQIMYVLNYAAHATACLIDLGVMVATWGAYAPPETASHCGEALYTVLNILGEYINPPQVY